MAYLSISAAARATGKDRGTIKRYLADGRLSSTPDASGNPKIDTSELLRVFGALKTDGSSNTAPDAATDTPGQTPGDTPAYAALQTAIESLNGQLRASQEREEWLKGQLATEQERSRELERRLLPPGESPQEKPAMRPEAPPQETKKASRDLSLWLVYGLCALSALVIFAVFGKKILPDLIGG